MKGHICLSCGGVIKRGLGRHVVACKSLPAPETLGAMMHGDKSMTVKSLAEQLGASRKVVRQKLLAPGSGWTDVELRQREKEVADSKQRRNYTCPHCGKVIRKPSRYDEHVARCTSLPSAQEIAGALNADPQLTLSPIAREYGVHPTRIRAILLAGDTNWDVEDLEMRQHDVHAAANRRRLGQKAKQLYRCSNRGCTIIVKRLGEICQFCELDSKGIRTYHQFADYAYAQRVNGSEVLKRYLDT
jgi:ribosomal protein L37AE/L43A